jgi:alpha/beta superfamily hydrolase
MHTTRIATERLTLTGPAGPLEALLETPGQGARAGVVVVCHPHPLHGGTMQNKVAHTLARSLCAAGLAAVRFNFRGVGASAGSYGGGAGELEDALAVLDWAASTRPGSALWLAGFSFGGCVALQASTRRDVQRVVAVAPAVDRCGLTEPPRCPWLVVQGLKDELVDARVVREWAARMGGGVDLVELASVDHYFHGRLGELRSVLEAKLGASVAELPAAS